MHEVRQVAPLVVAVDEEGDEEGVDAGHRGGLGGREHARQDAADDDHHGHQAPQRLEHDARDVLERDRLGLRHVAPVRGPQHQADQAQAEQEPREHAGEEQMRHRDGAAGGDRVDHGVVRGRDQQRLHRAADGDVGGEHARVALLHHLRNHHRADRRGVGDRGARDAAEQRAGQHVDHRHAAADEADEDLGEVDQARRHAALGHDAAREHEERDREQHEVVGAVGDLQHHRLERDLDPEGARSAPRGRARRRPGRRARTAARTTRAGPGASITRGPRPGRCT